ncbi:MAG: galactokinase [Anaerolineae bacterium]|nr:galactokinase [Anaerolineae bacterium]MDW8072247.1 galactokinase [Anaerolineae bacterium]
MELLNRVMEAFRQRFGMPPWYVVRAPGRVNLIGEHTDYNDGFVLPMAIDRAVWIALSPLTGPYVTAYSLDFDGMAEFALNDLRHTASGWAEYLKGVAWALQEAGYPLHGWRGVLSGDVPIGAGLSSSAALEMAVARAFAAVSSWEWKPQEMALLCQRAENQWVGVNCGIMDQMISARGKAGHALLLDCRSLEGTLVPLPPATAVVILDTATRRGLADSAYNERRAQCEAAARHFGVPALRDVTLEQFAAKADGLDEVTRRRARHVITENARTLQACEAMQRGDAAQLGALMQASHASLRDDFEVSSWELDVMVACAMEHPACYGARMTGAGFGGCAVALVQAEGAQEFAAQIAATYQARTQRVPAVYISQAADGADVVVMPT